MRKHAGVYFYLIRGQAIMVQWLYMKFNEDLNLHLDTKFFERSHYKLSQTHYHTT